MADWLVDLLVCIWWWGLVVGIGDGGWRGERGMDGEDRWTDVDLDVLENYRKNDCCSKEENMMERLTRIESRDKRFVIYVIFESGLQYRMARKPSKYVNPHCNADM